MGMSNGRLPQVSRGRAVPLPNVRPPGIPINSHHAREDVPHGPSSRAPELQRIMALGRELRRCVQRRAARAWLYTCAYRDAAASGRRSRRGSTGRSKRGPTPPHCGPRGASFVARVHNKAREVALATRRRRAKIVIFPRATPCQRVSTLGRRASALG